MLAVLISGICRLTSEGPDGTDISKSHDSGISFDRPHGLTAADGAGSCP